MHSSVPAGPHADPFLRLLDILAPRKRDFVAFLEAYFDDSGTHEGATALTVAGYLFSSENAAKFHRKWNRLLSEKNLPFFHMVDFGPGKDIYKHIPLEERIKLQMRLFPLIGRYAYFGFAASIREASFKKWFRSPQFLPNPYVMCCHTCINAIRSWMKVREIEVPVSFFFEAGHKNQSDADALMRDLFRSSLYANHAFIRKTDSACVQAADVLAWQQNKWLSDRAQNKDRLRRDFEALLSGGDHMGFIGMENSIYEMKTFGTNIRTLWPRLSGNVPGHIGPIKVAAWAGQASL